jgi:hypothetical protein
MGTTIVVDRTVVDVVIVITDDIDDSDIESCAIPSESYCERVIDGTTRKNKININYISQRLFYLFCHAIEMILSRFSFLFYDNSDINDN